MVSNKLSCYQIRPDIEKTEILYNGIQLPGVWPPQNMSPDSTTVFLDHDASDPAKRFKMFLRGPNWAQDSHGFSFVSPDGIHWGEPFRTGYCGDRSTMFYNPFRKKWIYSIRSGGPLRSGIGRARYYREHSDFIRGAGWRNDNVVFWTGADRLDPPDPVIGENAQLYNLSAVGYESIMLGIHQIHLGPPNEECRKQGIPKITELMLSYSRDGFASLSATENGGTLLTRLISFKGKHLFVNTDCPEGELKVEILNENNSVIAPFSADNCIPISSDSTIHKVSWRGAGDLSVITGTRIRFRFYLKNGDLYSFWLSPDDSGVSNGYIGTGWPGYTGWVDNFGNKAYDKAAQFRIIWVCGLYFLFLNIYTIFIHIED